MFVVPELVFLPSVPGAWDACRTVQRPRGIACSKNGRSTSKLVDGALGIKRKKHLTSLLEAQADDAGMTWNVSVTREACREEHKSGGRDV